MLINVANIVYNWKHIVSITVIIKYFLTVLMLNDAIMYCECL